VSTARRSFQGEIAALLDKMVMVATADGKTYSGILVGINPDTLSLCLENAKDEKGTFAHRVFLNGNAVVRILAVEKPFDLRALAERLEKVFPTLVRLYEDKGFIWVMDKIKVTADGVVEGTGPAAERVRTVYDHFLREIRTA